MHPRAEIAVGLRASATMPMVCGIWKLKWVSSGVAHSVTGPVAAALAASTVRSISRACSMAAPPAPKPGSAGSWQARDRRLREHRNRDRLNRRHSR